MNSFIRRVRYLVEFSALCLVLAVARILPAVMASNCGGWVGRILAGLLPSSKTAIKNLRRIYPHMGQAQRRDIILQMWENLGRVIFEYPHLQKLSRDHTVIQGQEILAQYQDKPAILFAAHLGNWEIGPMACFLQTGFVTHSLYRAPNNPYVDRLLQKIRSASGALRNIPKSRTSARPMLKALQDNQHLGILIDQKYNEGIKSDFMGHAAMTSTAFIELARKMDCALIPFRMRRSGGINFEIIIEPPLDITGRETEDILNECHDKLGAWINEAPEQWLWLHNRWKENDYSNDYNNDYEV